MTETHKNITDEEIKTLIESSVNIIGADEPKDYKLKPNQFQNKFKQSATAFSDILNNAALVETARRYEEKSAIAKENQQNFKKLSARATWAVFCATVSAALLTAVGIYHAG